MSSMACQLFFTVFVAFAKLASTTLTVEPVDTEVMVGQMVTLNCSTSSVNGGVKWYHISVGNEPAQKTIIYGNYRVYPPNENRIHVDRTFTPAGSNPFNLVIQNVRVEDAGRYQCEDEATGNRSMAQLIVLTSLPVCASNIDSYEVIGQNSCNMEPELLNLSCSVSYYGGAAPMMSWKKSGDSSQLNSMSCEYQENLTVATLSLKGDLAINGASYICQTTRARNSQYSCTSENVRIIYAFSNFSVANESVGHKVQCSALSGQTCSYQWLKDNAVVEGGSAEIQLQDSGLYRCQANCKIKEKNCSVVAAVVHVPVSSSRAGLIVLIVLVVICFVAVIVLLFLLCKSYRRKQKPPIPSPGTAEDAILLASRSDGETRILRERLQSVEADAQRLTSRVGELEQQNVKLNKRQKELGKLLYQPRPENVDYIMKTAGPITTKTTVREMRPISGLAIIDKELFIASHKSLEVEVYDSTTFKYNRGWALVGLVDAEDLASCLRNKSLYFSDRKTKEGDTKEIIRVDPNGNLISKWETGNTSGRLSVTDEGNVILTVVAKNTIYEYLQDGILIRTLELESSGITNPLHALKLKSGHYLVSHGMGDDPIHRVCIIDVDGEVIKSFGKKKGSAIGQMQGPICLAVDAEGSIIVADCNNSRLLLLNSVLEYRRILDSEESLFQFPVRICLNQSNGRMFVADLQSANHRLTVFDLDKPSLPDPVYMRH